MKIVLDTNILQEDYTLQSGRFSVLVDHAAKTQSSFVLPQIVYDELKANYERQFKERLDKANRAREQLNGLFAEAVIPPFELEIQLASAEYMRRVLRRLRTSEDELFGYRPDYLHDVLQRAIHRRAPCTTRGEEIRDAVLWLGVLDIASAAGEPIIFISRNTKQFTEDGSYLHPELSKEAEARGLMVDYVPSLEEFGRLHATPIAFISKEWLESEIDPDDIYDAIFDQVVETVAEIAHSRIGWMDEVEGGYSPAGGGVEVDEFFVNTLASGAYRVEIRWYGRTTIEYEIRLNESLFSSTTSRRSMRTAEVVLKVAVEAIVTDRKVLSWSILDASCDPD